MIYPHGRLYPHKDEKFVRMTALVVTGDVETFLQRLQWRAAQSPWRHLRFNGLSLSNVYFIDMVKILQFPHTQVKQTWKQMVKQIACIHQERMIYP